MKMTRFAEDSFGGSRREEKTSSCELEYILYSPKIRWSRSMCQANVVYMMRANWRFCTRPKQMWTL